MQNVIYPTVAVLALIALAYKIPPLIREPHSPTRRALVALLACLAWAPAVNTPAIYTRFDELVGVPNIARLVAHFGIIGFAVSVQILLLHWTVDQPSRRRTWIRLLSVTAAAAAMAVFFVLAPLDVSLTSEFTVRYSNAPYMAEYMLVYLGYFILALVDILRLSWRFAGLTQQPFLRIGLRMVSYGAVFGLAYCIEKGLYIATSNAGIELISPGVQDAMSPLLTGPGCLLMLVGFTIPSWGPPVAARYAWLQRLRTYHSLQPLWRLVYDATPEIALEPSPTTRKAVRDVEYSLVRRVVEIRDGCLALRPYFDARVAEAARRSCEKAGMRGDALQATVYAAVLAAACQAKTDGVRPADLFTAEPHGGTDIAEETTQLLRISQQLDSPIVRRATTRTPQPA